MFQNLTPAVKSLLLINVIVFLAGMFLKIDFISIFGLRFFLAESFAPYQIITHMFVHGGWGHLFSNMFALFIFGSTLERFWGSQRFVIFYLVTGLGASMLYSGINFIEINQVNQARIAYVASPNPDDFNQFVADHGKGYYNQLYDFINYFDENPNDAGIIKQSKAYVNQIYQFISSIPMVGASGAIFGILMAFGMLFPNTELMLLFFPVPIKAKYFVLFYGAYELYAGIQRATGDNVAHFAHLGGMLFAFLLIKYWRGTDNRYY
jgi:membrane associated rhomboid family serine protease